MNKPVWCKSYRIRLAPVLPAIVESLHSERPEQFGLNDARTAFLLRNCVRTRVTVNPVGLQKHNGDKHNTHTSEKPFSALPV